MISLRKLFNASKICVKQKTNSFYSSNQSYSSKRMNLTTPIVIPQIQQQTLLPDNKISLLLFLTSHLQKVTCIHIHLENCYQLNNNQNFFQKQSYKKNQIAYFLQSLLPKRVQKRPNLFLHSMIIIRSKKKNLVHLFIILSIQYLLLLSSLIQMKPKVLYQRGYFPSQMDKFHNN